LWYVRRPSLTDVHSSGGLNMSELERKPDVIRLNEREGSAQDSKANQPDNESHKEDFDELLKRAVQVK
jgi:hypothetical protein